MLIGMGLLVCLLFAGSLTLFLRRRSLWALLQPIGAACLMLVALAHIVAALSAFP
jgi:hypothetical protein